MKLDPKNFTALMDQMHGPSLLLGLCLGAAAMGIILLVVYNRVQRSHLLLSLRMEQSLKNNRRLEDESGQLHRERNNLREQNHRLERDTIGLEASLRETRTIARERQQLFEQTSRQMEDDFGNLSRKVLAEQGRVLRDQHADGLKGLLLPVRDQLDGFKKKVEDVYDREFRDRVSLIKEIEHLKNLNERISRDAVNLTQALQGANKLQGQWGEMVLERLLEESGLRPGLEFETQVSIRDENDKLKQPDVIIHLPGKREVIIDAKVSLNSYLEACRTGEAEKQELHLKSHLLSLQKHISGLSSKQYQQLPGLTTVDFVLLFIPVEGAFQAAISKKPDLLTQAMRRRVVIAGPSTLLAILRTIHHMWRLDEQGRNGLVIAKEAGNLYDKFVGFVEAFTEVGTRLDQAKQSWQVAEKRLATGKGNLINRAAALKKLGVQPGKDLPGDR
ncbi:MAG: DNA recombination protein RmuC [Thermodesulfobacteriota bacterium]|nr:DNA recombination protein RmuC [Thermodesulfobacteriota bacterium]